jgi:hypothetical protein
MRLKEVKNLKDLVGFQIKMGEKEEEDQIDKNTSFFIDPLL